MKSDDGDIVPSVFFLPVCCGVIAQMFCAGLVLAVTVFGFPSHSVTQLASESPPPVHIAPATSAEFKAKTDTPDPVDDPTVATDLTDVSSAADSEPKSNSDAPVADAADVAMAQEASPVEAPAAAAMRPLDDVRVKSRILTIAGEGIPDEIPLCQIAVDDVSQVKLELLGKEFSKPRAMTIELERSPIDEQSCTWNIKQLAESGFDRIQDVGVFSLMNQQFGFQWAKDADKGKLPFCKLKISADSDSEVCELWSPVRTTELRVSFSKSIQELSPFVPSGVQLPPAELLRVELTLEGWPEHELSGTTLLVSQPVEIAFPHDDTAGHLLKIQLVLKADRGQPVIQASHITSVPKSPSRRIKGDADLQFEDKPLSDSELEKLSRDTQKVATKYQKELEKIETDMAILQAAIEKLDERLEAGFRQDIFAQQKVLQRRQDLLEEKATTKEELANRFSDAHAAIMKTAELCAEIEDNGRIQFQLIRPLEGRDADVVVSSSGNANVVQAIPEVP